MHELYGAVFSLYTFNYHSKDPEYDISYLPSKYAEEFKANAEWLKFGFHARDDKKKYNSDESDAIKADYENTVMLLCMLTLCHLLRHLQIEEGKSIRRR